MIPMYKDFYCEKILSGELAVDVVFESELVLAFHHTRPYFERHIVIIPKEHIESFSSAPSIHPALAIDLFKAIGEITKTVEQEFGGCRVCSNIGDYQSSKHLHLYIHAGRRIRAEDGTLLKALV